MRSKSIKSNKGFTLVEMLGVIVIIGIIAAIAVPVFTTSSRKTKENLLRIKIANANQSAELWGQENLGCFKSKGCTDKISPIDCEVEGINANDECYIIALKTLAQEGYFKYDDKKNELILNPLDNSLMNEEQILLIYNRAIDHVSYHPSRSYLYKIVAFEPSLQKSQTHNVTINNLFEVHSIQSNTGTTSFTRNDDNISITLDDGVPISSEWNDQLYNKVVTESSTSSSDEFDDTFNYDYDGYSGILNKSGSSSVISGAWIEEHTKYVTAQTNRNYNSDGYTGTLTSYVYSGSYYPGDSFTASHTLYKSYYNQVCWIGSCAMGNCLPTSYYYNSGGYSGTLTRPNGAAYVDSWSDNIYLPPGETDERCDQHYSTTLTGTVSSAGYDTRVYRYQGYVTRPGYDTRVWEQNYSGTVYKGGEEHLYSYKATIAYILK